MTHDLGKENTPKAKASPVRTDGQLVIRGDADGIALLQMFAASKSRNDARKAKQSAA